MGLLLLFDIDGTLVTSNGIGRTLLNETLEALHGAHVSTNGIAFSGRTDRYIVSEALRSIVSPDRLDAQVAQALEAFVQRAEGRIGPMDIRELPGVRRLLSRLQLDSRVQLGLVTGNMERTAYQKLSVVGLDAYFPFGAFGRDHADRNELPPVAVRRAMAHGNRQYAGHQVVIIGDSAHDVRCAHASGAYAVAVASGWTPREALAAEDPHLLLDDLADVDGFYQEVVEPLCGPQVPAEAPGVSP